jgi:hypothetical protein
VRDHYLARWGKKIEQYSDEHCWHYHHPSPSGVGNEWNMDWSQCPEFEQIISRQILERGWFPSSYRAGGTLMDPVSSRWVDSWFPVDFTNRAPVDVSGYIDWSGGVNNWSLYHPGPENFMQPGHGRRFMARCLDLVTRMYQVKESDIEEAFERAARGQSAVVSAFDHDYRDIADRIDTFREMIGKVAKRYPLVPWSYAAPAEAVRNYAGIPQPRALGLRITAEGDGAIITADQEIFQSMPWLAVKAPGGAVTHEEAGLLRHGPCTWRWTPRAGLLWEELAAAGSTFSGSSAVANFKREKSG